MIGPTADPQIFDVGTLIADRYQVTKFVGSGAMGWVLQAVDRELGDRTIALKLLYPHLAVDEKSFSRFRNEVLLASKLAHPNVVRTYDLGKTENGQYFISMEYVHGMSLKQALQTQGSPGLPLDEVCRILYNVCLGIQHAHQHGITHRDLKPDNILVSNLGEVKIVDFGIARSTWQEHGLTQTGAAVGTPYYMSPEQIKGTEVDARSDIYSLGIMAFELATGAKAFDEENFFELAQKHMYTEVPKVSSKIESAPGWYEKLVETAVQKKKEDRFQSMEAVIAFLQEHASLSLKPLQNSPRITGLTFTNPDSQTASTVASTNFGRTFILSALGLLFVGLVVMLNLLHQEPATITANNVSSQHPTTNDSARFISEQNKKSNQEDKFKRPPLHVAAFTGELTVVQYLVENGGDVNAVDSTGNSVLQLAVTTPNTDLTKYLLENKADISARNGYSSTVMHIAAARNQTGQIQLLNSHAPELIHERNNSGGIPLHSAAIRNNSEAIELLAAMGSRLDTYNSGGFTSLHSAIARGNIAAVRALLAAGASTELATTHGISAIELAERKGHPEIKQLLVQKNDSHLE